MTTATFNRFHITVKLSHWILLLFMIYLVRIFIHLVINCFLMDINLNANLWWQEIAKQKQKKKTFFSTNLVLAKAQCWVLELLNGLLIKVPILLPKLQQLRRRKLEESEKTDWHIGNHFHQNKYQFFQFNKLRAEQAQSARELLFIKALYSATLCVGECFNKWILESGCRTNKGLSSINMMIFNGLYYILLYHSIQSKSPLLLTQI